jgi:hypothetical protein
MMGIMVPEKCWASNKICNKNHLLHLIGILFPHINIWQYWLLVCYCDQAEDWANEEPWFDSRQRQEWFMLSGISSLLSNKLTKVSLSTYFYRMLKAMKFVSLPPLLSTPYLVACIVTTPKHIFILHHIYHSHIYHSQIFPTLFHLNSTDQSALEVNKESITHFINAWSIDHKNWGLTGILMCKHVNTIENLCKLEHWYVKHNNFYCLHLWATCFNLYTCHLQDLFYMWVLKMTCV